MQQNGIQNKHGFKHENQIHEQQFTYFLPKFFNYNYIHQKLSSQLNIITPHTFQTFVLCLGRFLYRTKMLMVTEDIRFMTNMIIAGSPSMLRYSIIACLSYLLIQFKTAFSAGDQFRFQFCNDSKQISKLNIYIKRM